MRKLSLVFLKRPRVFTPLLVILLVAAAMILAVRNLNSPAQGQIINPPSTESKTAQPPAAKSYQDDFISFNYPSSYDVQPSPKDKTSLDSVKLIDGRLRDRFAALALTRESLAGDSGLNYRKIHPELYKTVSSASQMAIFSKLDGTEYTGFVAHNDEVLSISLTAVSTTDLSGDYHQIADSLKWRQ